MYVEFGGKKKKQKRERMEYTLHAEENVHYTSLFNES
jgi:hypothetical protein